jgi:hypothetical protein
MLQSPLLLLLLGLLLPAGNWVVNDEVIMPVDKAPIHLAVEAGAADIVQLLLAAGEPCTHKKSCCSSSNCS